MRTERRVRQEIKELTRLRALIPLVTLFGDDNVAAIDAEIEVLKDLLREEYFQCEWRESEHINSAALRTSWWLFEENDQEESPAAGWRDLIGEKS
jgi:hypothetical protein